MQNSPFRKVVMLFFCICSLVYSSIAAAKALSLKKAIKAKLVTINAISNGGASGKSLKIDVTNNTDKEIAVDVDPGLIFTSEDTAEQDLVTLGSESLVLAPATHASADLQTFCGKSYGRCPVRAHNYTFRRQGDSIMVKALQYVKANNIDISIAQRMVWTFTNGKCVNTIYDAAKPRMSEDLMAYVANLKKVQMPEFYTEYKIDNVPGRPVLVEQRSKVYITLHWGHEGYRHMYVVVYKANGEVYKQIEADRIIDKQGNTVQVEFDSNRDLAGTYIVKLHDDTNKTWDQKTVMVGVQACDMPKKL